MKLAGQTILITGGSSGIGLALTLQLFKTNTVIICGRSAGRLEDAKRRCPGIHAIPCDIAVADQREQLLRYLLDNNLHVTVLINNAAIVHKTNFAEDDGIVAKAGEEIAVNLLAPIALTKTFLTASRNLRAIVNITTGLVYAPRAVYPIYNATKAGLHAFTQVLRHQLRSTGTSVIEVLMPVVDTPWHQGTPPRIAISPDRAATEMIAAIGTGKKEIRVGAVKMLYILSRISPAFAFNMINRIR